MLSVTGLRGHCPLGCALVGMAVMLAVLTASPARAHRHEDPYRDILHHWAYNWIDVLWSEGVTDGFRIRVRSPVGKRYWQSRFLPDREIRLDEWTVLMAKVFNLAPLPGSRRHWLPGGQEVSGWLRAAQAAGWLAGNADWERDVRRETAVRTLVDALDLEEYSLNLPASTVNLVLGRFRDSHRIQPANRPYLAAATFLGIVEGYPDRTFRPEAHLTRAEAATLLARSALARADAAPNPFFPDGDGIDDQTNFTLTRLRNRNLSRWRLVVEDYRGKVLWSTGTDRGLAPVPPDTVRWSGHTNSGTVLPPGEYYYRFTLWDRNGQAFHSVRKPLRVGWRRLEGEVEPNIVQPGESLMVRATTWGDALRVSARWPEEAPSDVPLARSATEGDTRRWQVRLPIPLGATPGTQTILLSASFPGTMRTRTLTFVIRDPVQLTARLYPDTLPAGQSLTIEATTTNNVRSVWAELPDGSALWLERLASTRWQGTWIVPLGTPEGVHPVEVRAETPYGPRHVPLQFTVQGDIRESLQAILSD